MELELYETARARSQGLFNNALLLPVAAAIAAEVKVGGDFTAPEVRGWLDGRAESNQIREPLRRIEATAAIEELPYPGRPHPRRWQRAEHPLWPFVADWVGIKAAR